MDEFFLAFAGFFVGFFVCTRVGTCVYMFIRERRAAGSGAHWPIYMAVAFHSGPWFLAGTIFSVIWFFYADNPPAWSYWFLKGFCFGPVLYAVVMLSALRRFKARKASESQA